MTTVYDVSAERLLPAVADALKQRDEVKPPVWAPFVKTGVGKEQPPEQADWWYMRSASILRRVYIEGPIGVRHLRQLYTSKENRGSRPSGVRKGGGSIVRTALQQLEKAGYIKQVKRGKQVVGRSISPQGQKFLDNLAHKVKE